MKEWLVIVTEYSVILVNAIALVVIVFGTVQAFAGAMWLAMAARSAHGPRDIWLRFGRWLVAGLTFQLAADILETSIAPSWDEVGKLAAIAVIRTGLNYFLERDLNEIAERKEA